MTSGLNFLQTALWTVLFIVPGFIAAETKHYWMMTTPSRTTEKTVESICWSFITYFLLSLVPDRVFELSYFADIVFAPVPEKVLFSGLFLKSYIFIMMVAVLAGFLYAYVFPVAFMSKYLGRTPYARVWDEFFKIKCDAAANNGVWVELKDSTQWVGKLNSASDTPGSSELWLTDVRKYQDGNICDTAYSDMLLNVEAVSKIFVVKEGLLCKPLETPPNGIISRIVKWINERRRKLWWS